MAARRIILFIKSLGAVGHKDPPPDPTLILQHSEPWILGPPPMGDPLHEELWDILYPLAPPDLDLLHTELWST